MKNYLIIEQDDADFTIEDAHTEAEKNAEEIIKFFTEHEESVRKAARAAHPVRVSPSARALVGDVENYKSAIEKGMHGFSYTRAGAKQIWKTPKGTLVAEFVGCVGSYRNKFSFEII